MNAEKILVVSDSHGDRQILVDILEKFQDRVSLLIHCGDSELPAADPLFNVYQVVGGNCDFDSGYHERRILQTNLDRIYVTHGHLSNVRFGLSEIAYEAREQDATIVLFGHTHQIGCEVVQHRLYLNPGSISQPRGPIQKKAFAVIEATKAGWQVQYYGRDFEPIADLHFTFKR
ncbi:metallophosphoesterase [Enterococcus diestrammenae]|uniref:Phosphoesterase n=1 Tax=Enterococcus diestrammenae TaxID=1155073 RepID=A0ABV0F202_9ENTE|nr:metallophosphoesterase [Enterococcus diestrammenae]KAF1295326.1 YfcE family phosphodiesterase [Enterococcus diestrammenae]